MSTLHKVIVGLVALILATACGYFYGKGDKEVVIQEKVVTKEGETRTVYKDRIITKTKIIRPDGTVEEREETKQSDKVVDKKKTSTEKEKDTESRPILAKYSVAGYVLLPVESISTIRTASPDYGVIGGYRLIGPVWLEAGGNTRKEFQLGVRIEL